MGFGRNIAHQDFTERKGNGTTPKNQQTHQVTNGTTKPRTTGGDNRQEEVEKCSEIEKTKNKYIQTNTNEQGTSKTSPTEKTDDYSEETTSANSNDSMDVPAKKYLGATGVKYIQLGQASHVQENEEWNLEETVRQDEQNSQQIKR